MTDSYAGGFLDGWAAAAETLRTRFDLIPRDVTADPRINGERLGGVGGHSDSGRPWFVGPQPLLVREMRDAARHQQATERILSEAREQVANTHPIDLRVDLDCASCTLHLMVAGACQHCGWAMP